MSRFGSGLQGAFLGLSAAYLLTLLLGVWLRGWPLNPFFAGVALLGLGLQRLSLATAAAFPARGLPGCQR